MHPQAPRGRQGRGGRGARGGIPGRGQQQQQQPVQRGSPGLGNRGGARFGPPTRGDGTPGGAGGAGARVPPPAFQGGQVPRPAAVGGGGVSHREGRQAAAKLFGSGKEQLQFESDKEAGIWKVAPAPGLRFSQAFLQGLSRFVAFQLERQQQQRRKGDRKPQPPTPPQGPTPPTTTPPTASGADHGRAPTASQAGSPSQGGVVPLPGDVGAMPEPLRNMEAAPPPVTPQHLHFGLSGSQDTGAENWVAVAHDSTADLRREPNLPLLEEGPKEAVQAAAGSWQQQQQQQEQQAVQYRQQPGLAQMLPGGVGGHGGGEEEEQEGWLEDEQGLGMRAGEDEGDGEGDREGEEEGEEVQIELLWEPSGDSQASPRVALLLSLAGPLPMRPAAEEDGPGAPADPAAATATAVRAVGAVLEAVVAPACAAAAGELGGNGEDGAGEEAVQQGLLEGEDHSRSWWPPNALAEVPSEALPVASFAEEGEEEEQGGQQPVDANTSAAAAGPGACVQLSLRLERMGLTDREAGMLADWHAQAGPEVCLRKLWLYDNELGDEGARHVARMLHPAMREVHLSHNRLTVEGAGALLRALHVGPAIPAKPLWLRIEWNRVSLESLVQLLDREHSARGLVVDIPQPARSDAAPSLPCLPSYLSSSSSAAAASHGERGGSGSEAPGAEQPESDATSTEPEGPSPSPPPLDRQGGGSGGGWRGPGSGGSGGGLNRSARSSLRFLVGRCHARLPWLSCQFQLPQEAEVLRAVRRTWGGGGTSTAAAPAAAAMAVAVLEASPATPAEPLLGSASAAGVEAAAEVGVGPPASGAAGASGAAAGGAEGPRDVAASSAKEGGREGPPGSAELQQGPLLLFLDTSALLSMLGAHASVALPTNFSFRALADLAQAGRFGRALPPQEQVFVIVPDSVAKQLDGLKNDPQARVAVRYFLSQGLDAWGPAGLDFLTVLGGHEGEGLVREHGATVAGSNSQDVGSVGQRADHKIVEVALFFQHEILTAAAAGGRGSSAAPSSALLAAGAAFPVLLLSGDNAQVQLARSHGLPAARMHELAPLERWLQQQAQAPRAVRGTQQRQALGASLIRTLVGAAATTGLSTVALRSIHHEFDCAVACLRATADALRAAQSMLHNVHAVVGDASMAPEDALATLRSLLGAGAGPGAGPAGAADALGESWGEELPSAVGARYTEEEGSGGEGARSPQEPPLPQQGGWVGVKGGGLVAAVQRRLSEWEGIVRSQQSPSRVLKWAGAQR